VDQLGDLGIEPVQIERVGVEERGDRARLGDVCRERHVVPERVAAIDAAIEGQQRGPGPLGGDDQCDDDRCAELQAAGRRRLAFLRPPLPPPAGHPGASADQHGLETHRPSPDDQAGGDQQDPVEDPEDPEQLGDQDQDPDREHRVGEDRRRSRPPRQRCASGRSAGNRHRQRDGEQADHAEDVIAGAAHFPFAGDPPGWAGGVRRLAAQPLGES
jgi:hypothetical protein